MDLLKEELRRKRQAHKERGIGQGGKKYFRRSDLVKEDVSPSDGKDSEGSSTKDEPSKVLPESHSSEVGTTEQEDTSTVLHLPRGEVVRRLRERGEPIRLFGESDKDVCLRLRQIELLETDTNKGLRNDFKAAMEMIDQEYLDELARQGTQEGADSADLRFSEVSLKMDDLQEMAKQFDENDEEKVSELILSTLKFLLSEWAKDLNSQAESVKRSYQGKFSAATQRQTADYLKPLFKQMKKKTIPKDLLTKLGRICKFTVERDYVKANDAYLEMAIGNAPWPIGVTMVGIHARTGREKIFAQNVAHVLNDETQRKYIQGVKRLVTVCQRQYPTDPSKSVEYQKI